VTFKPKQRGDPMKVGIKLHHSGAGASPEHMLRWAQFAETLGFHLAMVGDHVGMTSEVRTRYPTPYYEPFTSISWLAGQTKRIKLGISVAVVPYRHPVYTAQLTANVDRLSGGRFILGVGVGWAESEFTVLDAPFHRRGAMTDDYLGAMEALWTNEVADYEGAFVSYRDVKLCPKPAQSPHPPIWVGGPSEAALRRVVRFGDAWHPIGIRVDWLRDVALPELRQMAETEGRPVPALCPRICCRLTDSPLPEDQRLAGEGTLDQVHADLEALQELGASYVLLDTKRNNPGGVSPRHHEEAWRIIATVGEKVVDLKKESVR